MNAPIDLEQRLTALGAALDWPPPRDISPTVGAAIRRPAAAAPARRNRWARWSPAPRPALVAAAVVLVVAGVLAAWPTARQAVASLLGIGGVEVRVTEDPLTPGTAALDLGPPVSLADARARAGFDLEMLDLGQPSSMHLDSRAPGGIVHLVYDPRSDLPPAQPSGIGALHTQFRSTSDPLFTKEAVAGSGAITTTEVDGQFALWVTGPSHVLVPRRNGEPVLDEARLSANALVWTTPQGVTHRLESALPMTRAVELAETLN